MRAAVCYELGKPLVVEDVRILPPGPGEVRVRVATTAICHSDIHAIRPDWEQPVPIVAGHEAAGVVEQVGEGVTLVRPGDRVVLSLIRSCGRCFYCATGAPELCDHPFDDHRQLGNLFGKGNLCRCFEIVAFLKRPCFV